MSALDSLPPRSPQPQQRHLHRVLSSSSSGNSTVASAVAAATCTSPAHACVLAPLHATHASTARDIAFLSPCSSTSAPHLQPRQQRHRQPHQYGRHRTCRRHQHQHAGHCTSTLAAPGRGPFTARTATMHCQHHAAAVHRRRTINNSNRPDSWFAPTPLTLAPALATSPSRLHPLPCRLCRALLRSSPPAALTSPSRCRHRPSRHRHCLVSIRRRYARSPRSNSVNSSISTPRATSPFYSRSQSQSESQSLSLSQSRSQSQLLSRSQSQSQWQSQS